MIWLAVLIPLVVSGLAALLLWYGLLRPLPDEDQHDR